MASDSHSSAPRAGGLPAARAVRLEGQPVSAAPVDRLREQAGRMLVAMRPVAEDAVRYFFAFLPLILPVLMAVGMLWLAVLANGP